MNKRSAMVVAAGVVAAMAAGAISLSAGGSDLAQADTRAPTPRVRTVHRTITVHRTAAPAPSAVRTIAAPGSSMTTSGGDDPFETENESEQEFESEDGHQGSSDDAQATFSSSGHGESGDD